MKNTLKIIAQYNITLPKSTTYASNTVKISSCWYHQYDHYQKICSVSMNWWTAIQGSCYSSMKHPKAHCSTVKVKAACKLVKVSHFSLFLRLVDYPLTDKSSFPFFFPHFHVNKEGSIVLHVTFQRQYWTAFVPLFTPWKLQLHSLLFHDPHTSIVRFLHFFSSITFCISWKRPLTGFLKVYQRKYQSLHRT